jgi:sarcosine oxidase subunit alpha
MPPSIEISFEGRTVPAVPGEPVALALWRAGERILARSVKYHRPRGIQCMQEHCASCLVRIDGIPNRFACTTPCADGLEVSRQNAFPSASADLFRAIDWAFPETFNHHEMFAGVPVASQVMAKVARKLAGLGELPEEPGRAFETPQGEAGELRVRTLVIGLGRVGREHVARLEPGDLAVEAWPRKNADVVWPGSRALGLYLEADAPVLLMRRNRALIRVRPQRLVLCTGSRAQIPPFPGSDLPGVMTDLAARLIASHGVVPGRRALVMGEALRVAATAEALRASGMQVTEAPAGTKILEAKGKHTLHGAILQRPGEATTDNWRGDLLAIAGFKAPAFELAAQAGAELTFVPDRGFAVKVDAAGRTSVPWLFAFGSCSSDSN